MSKITQNKGVEKLTFGGPVGLGHKTPYSKLFKDKQGNTRFEIDDSTIKINFDLVYNTMKTVLEIKKPLSLNIMEVIQSWEGFMHYPMLKTYVLKFMISDKENDYIAALIHNKNQINFSVDKFQTNYLRYLQNEQTLEKDIKNGNNNRQEGSEERRYVAPQKEKDYIRIVFRRKLVHELQHATQSIDGNLGIPTRDTDIAIRYKTEFNHNNLSLEEFIKQEELKHGKNFKSIIYEYSKTIPQEAEAYLSESRIDYDKTKRNKTIKQELNFSKGGPIMEKNNIKNHELSPNIYEELSKIAYNANADSKNLLKEVQIGIGFEKEHDHTLTEAGITGEDLANTRNKIILDHLREMPNYYTELSKMEENHTPSEYIMKDGGIIEAKENAKQFFENLTSEQKEEIANKYKSIINEMVLEQEKYLADLILERDSLLELKKILDEKRADYSKENHEKRIQTLEDLKANTFKQRYARNKIQALKNHGDVNKITDRKGSVHEEVPNFINIETKFISFDIETILIEPLPIYIPEIDEEIFAQKGYVFDVIRISKDNYLLAVNGFKEYKTKKVNYTLVTTEEINEDYQMGYVLVTLDQLALINDYYFLKAKALVIDQANQANKRQEAYYDSLKREIREKHHAQKNYYESLPITINKKISKEDYEKLSLEEKELLYKPFKKRAGKRLESRLQDNEMWVSFHNMYERFVDPNATTTKKLGELRPYAHPDVFAYWRKFREMLKWKIKDIAVQRIFLSEVYSIAVETSFGKSNTSDVLKEKYGILVKRQNGDKINLIEIDQIKTAWININKTFGGLRKIASDDNLKISHTGRRLVFASKAAGMYIPNFKTIAASMKFGETQFQGIMAHEVAHWIDSKLGESNGKRYFTDDFESSAGRIAMEFRKLMNQPTESDYVNSTKECFARAMEQYFSIENFGIGAELVYSYKELDTKRTYITEEHYVNELNYTNTIKPLIQVFFEENKDFFKYDIVPEPSQEDINLQELSQKKLKITAIEAKLIEFKNLLQTT